MSNREYEYKGVIINGFVMILFLAVFVGACQGVAFGPLYDSDWGPWVCFGSIALAFFAAVGFFIQQPNRARVMLFFGKYCGTFRGTGFYWVNPLMARTRVSLRLRNLDIDPIKVNDKVGNPVMIGMVLVWKVTDTYRAVFDIDSSTTQSGNGTSINSKALDNFVCIQSDAALREVTGRFAYDDMGSRTDEMTLRSGGEEINDLLERKINERLAMAGIEIVEARLNYLAYAPEIAAVMLRRQQASAIISAREQIVEGAVSMVHMALQQLERQNVVVLDDERKAAMVSNLLVVLCGDEPTQPVVNAGSLY